ADADGNPETSKLTTYLNDPLNITGYSQVLKQVETDLETGEQANITYIIGHSKIAQIVVKNGTEQEYYFTFDGHGSTRVLTDLTGAIVELYSFDAYGNAIGFNPAEALTEFLYSGEQFDSKIGQQYLRARYYDPATGRFNRLDPFFGNLSDPQSFHKYLYTHGDPVNSVDPSGKMSAMATVCVTVTVCTGVGALVGGIMGGWKGAGYGATGGFFVGLGIAIAGTLGVASASSLPLLYGVGLVMGGLGIWSYGIYDTIFSSWGVKPVSANNAKNIAVIEGSMNVVEYAGTYYSGMSTSYLVSALRSAGHNVTYKLNPDEETFINLCKNEYVFIFSHGGSDIVSEQTGFLLGGTQFEPGTKPAFITDKEIMGKIDNPNLVIVAGACSGAAQDNKFAQAAKTKYYIGKSGAISIQDSVSILQYGIELLNSDGQDVSKIKEKANKAGHGVTVYP
ncbi:MAG: RHS repeat-associated core domain-containing protein, partial [Planctomycetaceae bacterium]|nr:RHS repeat-associated core domain-containing protein [Planctomycetaceae bacterium]